MGGMKDLAYKEGLSGLKIYTLGWHRLKDDMNTLYKILKGDAKTRTHLLRLRSLTRKRGHEVGGELI